MKRGGLFLIGLLSAVITVISLNAAFGRSYNYYNHYNSYHHCHNFYDNRYHNKNHTQQKQMQPDSSTVNY